jgi:hypothetical protein
MLIEEVEDDPPVQLQLQPQPLVHFACNGGWGDRVTGIVTAMAFAHMLGRPLRVLWRQPASMSMLAHAETEWPADIAPASSAATARIIPQDDLGFEHAAKVFAALQSVPAERPIVLESNLPLLLHMQWTGALSEAVALAVTLQSHRRLCAPGGLLTMAPHVEAAVAGFGTAPHAVAIQIRLGDIGAVMHQGPWEEPYRDTIAALQTTTTAIAQFIHTHRDELDVSSNGRVFLAPDDARGGDEAGSVRALVRSALRVVGLEVEWTPGVPTHLCAVRPEEGRGAAGGPDPEGQTQLACDFLLMSRAKRLFCSACMHFADYAPDGVREPQVSGFASAAALVGGHPGLYSVAPAGDVAWVPFTRMRNTHKTAIRQPVVW